MDKKTIYVELSGSRNEDDVMALLDSLEAYLGKEHISSAMAIAITTDLPQVVALINAIPVNGNVASSENVASGKYAKAKNFKCVECEAPVIKRGNRCKACAMRLVGKTSIRVLNVITWSL